MGWACLRCRRSRLVSGAMSEDETDGRASRKTLPLAAQILIGLAVGAIVGLLLPAAGRSEGVDRTVAALGLGGRLWLQALQMTILPLVFALLTTLFIRSKGLGGGGRTTRRALVTIFALYTMGVFVGLRASYALLGAFPVTGDMAVSMRAMAGEGVPPETLPWADAVLSLVPSNVVAAMAGGSLLPVLVFALVFGAALASLEESEGKRLLAAGLTTLGDVMFKIVGWVLKLAPIGVALLILPTVQAHGADIFAGLAHWIALSVSMVLTVLAATYLVAITVGRVPLGRFQSALFPAQSVAFGTQSSTGTMPVTMTSCRDMGLSEQAIAATMPLAAVIFRVVAPAAAIFTSLYAAQVYDLGPLPVLLVIGIGFLGAIMEMSFVGVPGAATFVAFYSPLAAIVGFPIEFIVVLLVVETIPDIFKTVLSVTGHATATAIVDRGVAQG